METIIRPAKMSDYAKIEEIMMQVQNLHVDLRPDIYKKVDTAADPEELDRQIREGRFFVAETEGKVVGILSILYRHVNSPHQVSRKVLYVETIAVDEPCRRMGVGHAMLEFLHRLKDEKGMDGLELQVNARNEAALAMYRKEGFTPKSVNLEYLGDLPQSRK